MAKAASIHFVAAKVAADKHNKREKDLSYVRKELENSVPLDKRYWEAPGYKSVYALRKQAAKEYYDKELTVKGNHGTYVTHRSMPKTAEPVKEGVVAINEHVTIEQLREFGEWCQAKWGITPVGIYIHHGEGHWAPLYEDEGQTEDMYRRTDGHEWKRTNAAGITEYWKPNLHAHMVFDWFNHETKRCYNLGPKVMIEMEDKLAECLGMKRGQRSNRDWLDSVAFKSKAEQERVGKEKKIMKVKKQEADAELAKAEKAVKALTTMVSNLQAQIDKGEGDVVDISKKLEDKRAKLAEAERKLQEVSRTHTAKEAAVRSIKAAGEWVSDALHGTKKALQQHIKALEAQIPAEREKGRKTGIKEAVKEILKAARLQNQDVTPEKLGDTFGKTLDKNEQLNKEVAALKEEVEKARKVGNLEIQQSYVDGYQEAGMRVKGLETDVKELIAKFANNDPKVLREYSIPREDRKFDFESAKTAGRTSFGFEKQEKQPAEQQQQEQQHKRGRGR